jgi:diamine N-acetyltransferase
MTRAELAAFTMNVSLREITSETVGEVIALAVSPEQQEFVAPNATSLAEALFSEEAWYRAIYADETLVGFVMLYDETLRATPPEVPNVGLWRLMIDQRYQRQGIGREVIRQVIEHVRQRPNVNSFFTSYVPGEGGPESFYLSLGFRPNGEVEDGEIVLVYPLQVFN